MKSLTVICPVYNEEAVIETFVAALGSTFDTLADRYDATMLFVVDRCEDRSLEILRRLAEHDHRIQVLGLSRRFGHQMSLVAGMDHADADVVIMMDSDLQQPPAVLQDLLARFEQGYDVVHTFRRPGAARHGIMRDLAARAFYALLSWLAEIPIGRSAADFRLISRRVLRVFQTSIRERNQFLRGLFSWVGFRATIVEYDPDPRFAGETKYSVSGLLALGLIGATAFSKKPLRLAILVGLATAAAGFALAALTLVQYYVSASAPPGWVTLVVTTSIFSGVQLFFLGVLGEYLGAVFDEVKARPLYIVEEAVNVPSPLLAGTIAPAEVSRGMRVAETVIRR